MNYLAHIYLTPENNELQVGNFIADSVRGKQVLLYPEAVREGIVLHRKIDAFTDQHEQVKLTKDRLRYQYGKYAGVIADVFYDHFLAKNFTRYSDISLNQFAQNFYGFMNSQVALLPEKVKYFLPYMISQNWLLHYGLLSGIERSLQGLSRRSKFNSGMETAASELDRNYNLYQTDFEAFFPELEAYVKSEMEVKSEVNLFLPAEGIATNGITGF